MTGLRSKSLTELRGIAQSYDIQDIFQKDVAHLVQAIEQKQKSLTPAPAIEIPKPEYDARLMTKAPARKSDESLLLEYLQPYIERGLKVTFEPEMWKMQLGLKTDQGTLRMPPRVVLDCARRIMDAK